MKKILLAVLSAALVAAVLISAGCVTTDTDAADPITGVWVAGNDEDICAYIFDDDQTGVYYSTFADEIYAKDGVEFLWENRGDGVYYLSNPNGGETTCILDAEAGTLTSKDNTVFRNIAAAFADEAVDPIVGLWAANDEFGCYLFVIADDNTAVYYTTYDEEECKDGSEYIWVNNGDGKYVFSSAGKDYPVTLDVKTGILTTYDNAEFRQVRIGDEKEEADPIVGTWTSRDEAGSYLYVFANDNTGMYFSTDGTEDSVEGAEFIWINEGKSVYHVTYAEDAYEEHCVLDAKEGTLTADDGTVFVKP